MTNTNHIKEIPILEVAHRLGVQVNRNKKAICFIHSDEDPSLSFNTRENYFKCFGCDETGDVIKLVMLYNNVDFKEALKWFEAEFGLKPGESPRPKPLTINLKLLHRITEPRISAKDLTGK